MPISNPLDTQNIEVGTITVTDEFILSGDAKTGNGIWVDAGGIKSPGSKPATAAAFGPMELPVWSYAAQAIEANEESISWNMSIPNRMDRSVGPYLYMGWSCPVGDDTKNVAWRLEYLWTSPGEDTAGAAQDTHNGISPAATDADGLVMWSNSALEAPSDTDVCLHCRLKRRSSIVGDTIDGVVEVHGVCLQFVSDKLGS